MFIFLLLPDIPTCSPGYSYIPHSNHESTGVCVSDISDDVLLFEEAWLECRERGAELLISVRETDMSWLQEDVWVGVLKKAYG